MIVIASVDLLRKTSNLSDWLTPEAVLAHYHNNRSKAIQAMMEAEMDGSHLRALRYF